MLVYDGGSEDDTIELLKKHSIHPTWVSQPDHGQASAVNCGLQEAKGKALKLCKTKYCKGATCKIMDVDGEKIMVQTQHQDGDDAFVKFARDALKLGKDLSKENRFLLSVILKFNFSNIVK